MNKKIATTMLLAVIFGTSVAYAEGWGPSYVLQSENVVAQADGPAFGVYYGAATMKRSKFGLSGRMMTKVATAGDPYTVWLVIFNHPQYCATSPCGEADLPEFAGGSGDPRIDVAVINGSGAISASDGNGGGVINADFEAIAGRTPDGICCFGSLARRNGMHSEVHLVVDKHPTPTDPMDEFFWTTHLTFPGMPGAGHRFSIFLPAN